MGERIEVALALVTREGRWLVSRRSAGRVFAGQWEFPGGKMQPGESPADAAVREVREEAGLAVEPVGTLGRVETAHGGNEVTLHLVRCRPGSGEPAASDPAVVEVKWASLEDLRSLRMPPANREIIDRLPASPDDGPGS